MSEYEKYIKKRFGTLVYDDNGVCTTDEDEYDWVLNGVMDYLLEEEMLEYAEQNPEATIHDMFLHFAEISPEGYPPTWTDEDIEEFQRYCEI